MYDVDAIEQQVLDAMAQESEDVEVEETETNDIDLQFDDENEIDVEENIEEEVEEEIEDNVEDDNVEYEEEETPQHRAFAEMRVQNKQLEEQLQQQQELLEIVRQGSGFETEEQMYQALLQAKPEIDKRNLGLDDDGYKKYQELQEREAQLQQQQLAVYHEQLDTRATKFQGEIDKISGELGINEDVIFQKLVDNGFTDMEEILMGANEYSGLLKSVLIDEIVEHRANERANKELSRKSVESDRINNTNDASASFEEKQNDLLQKELDAYKKDMGY